MAGTIVADTIQDGAGNSTAMDNAIYGSAKAWVTFNGSTGSPSINSSYNVSSVTSNGTGDYTITFTNALASANFVVSGSSVGQTAGSGYYGNIGGSNQTNTTTTCRVVFNYVGTPYNVYYLGVVVHR